MGNRVTIFPVFVPMAGCPHQCSFCNQRSITGRNPKNLLEDIKDQLDMVMEGVAKKKGYSEIAFFGGSFTCLSMKLQNTILDMAKPYIDLGIIDGIRLSTRPDYIEDPILKNLFSKGVTTIELGIQSTNTMVLESSERGYSYEEILPSLKNLKNYSFNIGLQMMVGLPEDTRQKSIKTALDFAQLKPDFVRIYPTLVVKGSALLESYLKGDYTPLKLKEAVDWVKDLRIIFESYSIPIIRTGLHASEGFDKGIDLKAGPYHPAFGEMVEASIYKDWMEDIIDSLEKAVAGDGKIEFGVNPSNLSKAIGQKRANILYLKERYKDYRVTIVEDRDLDKDGLKVTFGKDTIIYKRQDFIYKHRDVIIYNFTSSLQNT